MKKHYMKFLLIVILSCVYLEGISQKVSGFAVSGNIAGLKNGSKMFMVIKKGGRIDTASRCIAKQGSFTFKDVKLPVYPAFYLVSIQSEFVENLQLFLDQVGDVKIIGKLSKWPDVTVSGSKTHDDYLDCRKLRRELQAKDFLIRYPEGSAPADTITMYMLKECEEMIRQRPESFYLPYWIATMKNPVEDQYPQYKLLPDRKKPLYDLLSPKIKESYYGKLLAKQVGIKE